MRWKVEVAYDGTSFYGWATQPQKNTVQDFLQDRLAVIFRQEKVVIQGSGRTDSGVHARQQVFHFDGEWRHPAEHLLRALRSGLPDGILVLSVEPADGDFHARYNCVGKRYIYRIYEGWAMPYESRHYLSMENRKLDTDAMSEAASHLCGLHDFSSFIADRRDGSVQNPMVNIKRLDVDRDGPRIHITAEAKGFLYKMVRSLAGVLIDVGTGKLIPDDVLRIRNEKQRTMWVVTAPAKGLTLEKVYY